VRPRRRLRLGRQWFADAPGQSLFGQPLAGGRSCSLGFKQPTLYSRNDLRLLRLSQNRKVASQDTQD